MPYMPKDPLGSIAWTGGDRSFSLGAIFSGIYSVLQIDIFDEELEHSITSINLQHIATDDDAFGSEYQK